MRGPVKLEKKSSLPQAGESMNYGQQWPKAVRPQLPRDSSQGGIPRWSPGTMPTGGTRFVFDFSTGKESTKLAPTTRGKGPKVI